VECLPRGMHLYFLFHRGEAYSTGAFGVLFHWGGMLLCSLFHRGAVAKHISLGPNPLSLWGRSRRRPCLGWILTSRICVGVPGFYYF